MSLSADFPASDIFEWARSLTGVPVPTHAQPPVVDAASIKRDLDQLDYDVFHCDPVRYPRRPPNQQEWKQMLDALPDAVMEERSFALDSASLVEARTEETQCAKGKACYTYSQAAMLTGLDRPVILQRLPPPHPPFCLLCHRLLFASLLVKDRRYKGLMDAASQLEQPGPTPYVHRNLKPIQSFYNPQDIEGEYHSDFMLRGEEDDVIVMPMARVIRDLLRPVKGVDGFYWIDQSAMRYSRDKEAQIRPGETVQQLKERVSLTHTGDRNHRY
jgi:hypothetical protein